MARRKGSGRGKTTVNSRKSALENARERLKDDPRGTVQSRQTVQQQRQKDISNNNMEAATTTTTTTTKHYNKTAKLQNNHHRSTERRGTYRNQSGETQANAGDNVKAQKQTAKQAKAAAQRAAAAAAYTASQESGGNNKPTTGGSAKDPLAISNDATTALSSGSGGVGSKAARAKEAREQKTVPKSETAVAVANAITTNATSSVNNNNKHSDISNSSLIKSNFTLSQSELARKSEKPAQQLQQQQEASNNSNNNGDIKAAAAVTTTAAAVAVKSKTVDTATAAPLTAVSTAEPNTWNNSRYLHKKFKRLASTTDVDSVAADSQSVNAAGSSASSDAGSEVPQTRTTSLSSSASTSSISPPPATTPIPIMATITQPSAAAASNVKSVIATGLTNGHSHTEVSAKTVEPSNYNYNNNNKASSSVKYDGVSVNSSNKIESNNNESPISLVNHSSTTAQQQQQQQLAAQQYLDVEQLPQTMLHIFENQQSAGSSSNSGATAANANSGRYVCPYCNLNCTKPSVLQKHIRAHTNERPYPCDICGIAFKTNSNYYKHCRSRSHAARKRGIEVPISADDGLFGGSDQEGDPELSNSSSDVISRTASPMDDLSSAPSPAVPCAPTSTTAAAISITPQQLQQLQQQQQKQVQLQQQQQFALAMQQQQQTVAAQPPHAALPSTPSPCSISSAKSAYLQQPVQQQLPLGSPAAGTLPPPPPTATNTSSITTTAVTTAPKLAGSAEYKPYKPKFHNAAFYATTKEAVAAAAAAAAAGIPPGLLQPMPPQQSPQQLPQTPSHGMPPAAHLTILPQAQAPPPPPSVSHHPSLSPSTQVKLNNHINTHQLQLQIQQQQQQQQQPLHLLPPLSAGIPLHHAAAMSPKAASQRPDMVNAAAVAAANMSYMAAPRMIYPGAIDFPPEALHMMMPESRQKLHYQVQQYKWIEQELQQHLHKLSQQQQQQLQHMQSQPQPQQQQQQPQVHAPTTQPPILKPTALSAYPRATSSSGGMGQHASPAPSNLPPQPAQQVPLQYLTNSNAGQQPIGIGGSSAGTASSANSNTTASISSGLLHSNISNAAASGANKVADLVQEHITKLISQNEAIVENKAVLLQKKYPKGLNRSRSFNSNNGSGNGNPGASSATATNNASGGVSLVTTTAVGSESATNARLAQAIVQKQQQQQLQQQLQQQQHYQQQFQQQLLAGGSQALQMPPPAQQQQQQHFAQMRLEEHHHQHQLQQQQQQLMQPNGISKHLAATAGIKPSGATVPTSQQLPAVHQQQQTPSAVYRQQTASGPTGLPPHDLQRPTPSPTATQSSTSSHKDIMSAIQHMSPVSAANNCANASANALPLNLSAKPKLRQEETTDIIPTSSLPSTPSSTPRKRQSIENQISNSSNDGSTSSSMVGVPATAVGGAPNAKQPVNVSIIKNLLLNARGLAVPTGEGEDAVYNCPLCSSAFRTAEDLQLHNSTYCQGASSAPISPVSSPSYRYFRSNSMTLNLPELKNSLFRARDPLPLAKLAWYQLRTKPSSLVLSRLSASQAGSSKSTTTTTTSATSTAPTSSTSSNSIASCVASPRSTPPTAPPATLSLPDPNIVRLIDAPLPSPGPLLGKTPLVDFGNTSESRKSEDVIITKMHEDRQFDTQVPAKRAKLALDSSDPFVLGPAPTSSGSLLASTSSKRLTINSISGGDMQLLSTADLSNTNKKEERMRRFTSSGGCIIPISECSDMVKSPKMIRTPLLSGGSFQEVSPKPKEKENKSGVALPFINSATFTPKLGLSGLGLPTNGPQHFQFPINQITAFNPLTLPPLQSMSSGGEKIIPHVPGMPGPNSLTPQLPPPQHLQLPQPSQMLTGGRSLSPNRKKTQSPMMISNSASPKPLAPPSHDNLKSLSPFGGVQNVPSEFERAPPPLGMRTARNWNQNAATAGSSAKQGSSNSLDVPKKPFNFTRMADNISPRKSTTGISAPKSSPSDNEVRHFNFDHLTKDGESSVIRAPHSSALTPLHVDIASSTATTTPNNSGLESTDIEMKKTKFLRPTSLPLKPGTFTPKRHHGITPTANTLPLISPETPRPSKSCVQLYLNGHAYTYLGLKCSTKMFYCTVNCPQPSYVAGTQKLSMYSVWQVCAENNPHPLGFKPKVVMSLYDSRQKTSTNTMAGTNKQPYSLVVSQQTVMTPFENNQGQYQHHQLKQISLNTNTSESGEQLKKASAGSSGSSSGSNGSAEGGNKKETSAAQMLVGGYESHEDYTYIRGRGRGRYVCSECGIRCKKPSMLKKHIRTHTDVRPYTCKHCNFSFKTKGNLTKHMQSKTHFKKCLELGINPGPMPADGEFLEPEPEFDQQSTTSASGRTSSIPGESDSDDYSDNESESSDTDESKSRLLEHEAARGLLSLSMTPPIGQSVSPRPKSEPYPYQQSERVEPTAICFAGQMSVAATTTTSSTIAPNTHPTGIKRVISFSSPKPPFDYQKQEQYYSNPEESKPKHSNNAATASYESAPIDLTKPRATVNPTPSTSVTITTSVATRTTVEEYNPSSAVVPLPGPPVQTQAQIRDVIFGNGNNESGFLKTLISVSDKVRSSTEMLENYKNGDELSQAYQYHKAFQYHKIKQIQMNRSFSDAINVSTINHSLAGTPTMSTMSVSSAVLSTSLTTTTSASSGKRSISEISANTTVMANAINVIQTPLAVDVASVSSAGKITSNPAINDVPKEKSKTDLQVPAIEVSMVRADETKNDPAVVTSTATGSGKTDVSSGASHKKTSSTKSIATLPCKSSDEGEDSECISDQEQTVVSHTSKRNRNVSNTAIATTVEPHNAKLPAVVAQPGTTDFTGVLSAPGRTVVVGEDGLKKSGNNEIQPAYPRVRMSPDGRPVCKVCTKTFQTQGQLSLHMNIHYMERKFRCEPCGVSFRTQGHLQKHERAEAHKNKVMMTSTFGVPTTSNPRPFECTDCKIAFRIHGHLAKHLRSKTHVQKLECLQKLPFGTYAEIERAGISLTEIDTSDCENSLISLKTLAQKLIEKDPNKLGSYTTPSGMSGIVGGGNVGGSSSVITETTNANTNQSAIVSQDSASEDDFSAATIAAATAIASLDNDSATNTPKRANSTSEDEAIASGLNNNLKRRLPGNFSNGEESDNPNEGGGGGGGGGGSEKRARVSSLSSVGATSAAAAIGSPASITSSNASSTNN